MKKILRTILTVILLTVAFVFYMKWFNAPLAQTASNFVFPAEVVECDCGLSGEVLDENEVIVKLEKLEKHMNTLEDLIEVQNATNTENQSERAMPEEIDVTPEATEEELFEEFKIWRTESKEK
jgi:hypothetical protein